eukprot:3255475-Prorocentrum_lima.AAC.1
MEKEQDVITSVVESGIATSTGCDMLRLRQHVQTYTKWFHKSVLGWGQKNLYHSSEKSSWRRM